MVFPVRLASLIRNVVEGSRGTEAADCASRRLVALLYLLLAETLPAQSVSIRSVRAHYAGTLSVAAWMSD